MNSPKTGYPSSVRSPHPSINHSMNEAEKLQPYTEALERILLRLAEEEGLLGSNSSRPTTSQSSSPSSLRLISVMLSQTSSSIRSYHWGG